MRAAGRTSVSDRGLFVTWAALMLLAGLSLGLRFAHLGGYGYAAALGIAGIKAAIVALIFMELTHEKTTVRFAFLAGLTLLAVLLTFMIADVLTRTVPPLENPPGTEPRYRG
jgi:cytochrome c oxidase subunit IV